MSVHSPREDVVQLAPGTFHWCSFAYSPRFHLFQIFSDWPIATSVFALANGTAMGSIESALRHNPLHSFKQDLALPPKLALTVFASGPRLCHCPSKTFSLL